MLNVASIKNDNIGISKEIGSTANGDSHIIDKKGATRLLKRFGF